MENLEKFKKLVSGEKSGWLEKATYRKENEAWLDLSFAIAVRILSKLKVNKASRQSPKNQKELAAALGCSAQYVNKLLKGSENLQLETITKIERILNISLIVVPEPETVHESPLYKMGDESEQLIAAEDSPVYGKLSESDSSDLEEERPS